MAIKKTYTNESIQSLKGADRVRKRPAVIFGSDGIDGCCHTVFEILSNSIDEAREGFGDRIILTQYKDHTVEIEDFGRGIPVDYNKTEECYNWVLLFCELYAGSKYNNISASTYEFSLGINGLGLCATQCASEFMEAEIYRDGFRYRLDFKRGEPEHDLIKEPSKRKKTGSRIKWRPDLEVFTDIAIPRTYIEETLKKQAIVNAGVTFEYRIEQEKGGFETVIFFYPNGIRDYVAETVGEDGLCSTQYWEGERSGKDREDKPEYRVRMTFAVAFSNRIQKLEYYHNSSWLEHGGSPDRAVRTAFVNQLDALIRERKLYKKDESKISFADVEDCLILVSSSFSTDTSYENQTKKAINNRFIAQAMTEFLKHSLEIFFLENRLDADRIAQQVLINKRSRENAEKTRLNLKKTLATSSDFTNRVQKFVDCRTKDITRRELYIVEGDSALGACKLSRDSEFQAIIPVRGKILNCLKSEYDRILKSEIITDLVKVIGCGIELKGRGKKTETFDLNNLRWNKIIICTDADVDGYQIRTLILTMFHRLMPTLIDEGYVYIAESPLYEITTKDKTYFCYTEQEKGLALAEIGNAKYTVQRSKGLGENESSMMWMTTMNPVSRRLIRVTGGDAKEAELMFDLLLGDNLQGRKEYIANHGAEYLDSLDLS